MDYPQTIEISYSYTGFSQSLGDGSFPGPRLDADFANILATLNATVLFIQGTFRSDGYLRDDKLPAVATMLDIQRRTEEWAIVASGYAGGVAEQIVIAEGFVAAAAGSAGVAANRVGMMQAFVDEAQGYVTDAANYASAALEYASSLDVSGFMRVSSNLEDVADKAAARTNLGLGSLAQMNTSALWSAAPTGAVQAFLGITAPAGWLKAEGGTVGGPGSGASNAGSEMQALFDVLWATPGLAILSSAGVATTRGATATADWVASKRMTLPDLRGEFIRGLDQGRGVDVGRVAGTAQGDLVKGHTHTVSGTGTGTAETAGAHTHTVTLMTGDGSTGGIGRNSGSSTSTSTSSSSGAHTHTVNITSLDATAEANAGAENRPRNVALLYCIKI